MGDMFGLPGAKSSERRVPVPARSGEPSRISARPEGWPHGLLRKPASPQECDVFRPLYAFCLVDPAMRFIEVSPAMVEITGYSIQELSHMGVQEIIALESLESALNVLEQVDRLGWGHHTGRFYRKDGTPADIWMDLIQLTEDQYLAWVREVRIPKGSLATA